MKLLLPLLLLLTGCLTEQDMQAQFLSKGLNGCAKLGYNGMITTRLNGGGYHYQCSNQDENFNPPQDAAIYTSITESCGRCLECIATECFYRGKK